MADPHSPSDTHPTTTTSSSSNDNSQPWHHYATPTTPLRLENGDLPESFPWHVTATKEYPVGLGVGVPFPTPPVLESGEGTTTPFWYREATRKRPVRVSSPARSPHTHTPDDSQEDALKFPFLAGVGTASSPFRLKPRRQKPGNGTSAPTSSFLRRTISTDAMSTTSSPSRILAKYPTSEYAYESEDAESTSGETVLTTRSEPVNLSKAAMRNRHRYGLVGIGLGLGVGHRINNVVPPPLPAPPIPAESHVAIEERSPRFVPEHARTAGELSERHLAKSELADRRQDVQMWLNTIMPDATGQTIHTPVSPAHSIRRQTSQSALGVKYILPVAAVAAVDVEGSKGRAVDQVVQSADAIRPTFILPTAQARRSEVKVEEDAHHRSVDGISSSCKTIVPTFIVPTAQGYTSQIEINAHREVDGITKSTDAIVPEFILPTAQACTSDISYTPKTTLHVLPVPSTPVTEVLPSGADATVVVTDTAPSKPKTDASTAHLTEIPPLDVKQATPPIAPPAAEPVDGGFEPGPRPHLKRRTRSLRISQEQGVDSISREPSQDVNAARAVSEILGSYGNDTLDRPQQPQFSAAKAISAKIMNARGQLSPNGGTLNTDAIQYTVRNSTYSDTCTSGVGTAVDSGVGDLRRSQDVTEAMYTGKSAEDTGHQVMMAHNDLNASTSSLMSHLRNVIAARAEVAVTDPGAYVKPVARGLPRWLEASKGQQQRRLSLDIASRPTGYAAGLGTKHQFSKSQNDVSHHTLGDGRQHEDDDMWARRYSDRTDTEPPEPHHYQVQDVEAAPPRSSLSHPQPNPLTTTTTTHQNRPGLLAFLVSLAASLAYISTWSVLNLTAAMMIRAPPFGPGLTSMMAAGFPQMAFLVPGVGGVPVWIYIGGMLGPSRPLTFSLILLTLFTALNTATTSWNAVILLHACAGLVSGGVLPLSFSVIRKNNTTRRTVLYSFLVLVAVVVGLVVGPVWAHALLRSGEGNWKWVFGIPAVLAGGATLLAGALMWQTRMRRHLYPPASTTTGRKGAGLVTSALLAVALTLLAAAIVWGGMRPPTEAGGNDANEANEVGAVIVRHGPGWTFVSGAWRSTTAIPPTVTGGIPEATVGPVTTVVGSRTVVITPTAPGPVTTVVGSRTVIITPTAPGPVTTVVGSRTVVITPTVGPSRTPGTSGTVSGTSATASSGITPAPTAIVSGVGAPSFTASQPQPSAVGGGGGQPGDINGDNSGPLGDADAERYAILTQCRLKNANVVPAASASNTTLTKRAADPKLDALDIASPTTAVSRPVWGGILGLFLLLALLSLSIAAHRFISTASGIAGTTTPLLASIAAQTFAIAAFAVFARYPPLSVSLCGCTPSPSILYPLIGTALAASTIVLLLALPNRSSHFSTVSSALNRAALPGAVIAVAGAVLMAVDVDATGPASGGGFAAVCFGVVAILGAAVALVAVLGEEGESDPRDGGRSAWVGGGVVVGLTLGTLLATTLFHASSASSTSSPDFATSFTPLLGPETSTVDDQHTAHDIGHAMMTVYRAAGVPIAVVAAAGLAVGVAVARRGRW